MKISGFSMAKNADKLYYPLKPAIESVLPIVDEFVVAIGKGDADDRTREQVVAIKSDKVKIIDTEWDIVKYPKGMEYAHQSDIAKQQCSGDWLIYLQADEVIHEKYLDTIKTACHKYLHDREVEGFIFGYKHFWGDYWHYHRSHGWYPFEIRIIRNDPEIHSWVDAQSFRRIPGFDGVSYRKKEGTFKLKVIKLEAEVYHYGWVRPPDLMIKKDKAFFANYKGEKAAETAYKHNYKAFDYGSLYKLPEFKDAHPKVMEEWITDFHWKGQLNYSKRSKNASKGKARHEKTKNIIFSFIKYKILRMPRLAEFNNFIILRKK